MVAVESFWPPERPLEGRLDEPIDQSGRPFTRADLDAMPDDGRRYELVSGALIVSPAPSLLHQVVSGNLYTELRAACPAGLKVLYAPVDLVISEDTVVQPDIVVARLSSLDRRDLPEVPLLGIEILSPSTRRYDLMLKRALLETAGCQSYWVVDPDEPSLIAWDLHDGVYVQVAKVVGDEEFRATRPFEVCVAPAELIL